MNLRSEVLRPVEEVVNVFQDKSRLPKKCGGEYLNFLRIITWVVANVFPDELKRDNRDRDVFLTKLYYLVPMMISCNDWCDFGSRLSPDCSLLNRARDNVSEYFQNSWRDLTSVFGGDKDFMNLAEGYIRDSMAMRRLSKTLLKENYKDYLDIDSMLCIAVSLGVLIPSFLADIGFDPDSDPKNFDGMMKKYQMLFEEPRISGLHAMAMILKIDDDKRSTSFDKLMGNPSFNDLYGQIKPKEIRGDYLKIVADSQLPQIFLIGSELAARLPHIRRMMKDRHRRNRWGKLESDAAVDCVLRGEATMRTVFQVNSGLLTIQKDKRQ